MTTGISKSRFRSISKAIYSTKTFVWNLKRRIFLKRDVYRSMKPEIDRFMKEFDKENPHDELSRKYKLECIKSALKAYCSLCADGHSGYSISETMAFLRRMVNHLPLTPLTGDESEWNLIDPADEKDNFDLFQSRRSPSVFKKVYADKTVYNDVDRVVVRDIIYEFYSAVKYNIDERLKDSLIDAIACIEWFGVNLKDIPRNWRYKDFHEFDDFVLKRNPKYIQYLHRTFLRQARQEEERLIRKAE